MISRLLILALGSLCQGESEIDRCIRNLTSENWTERERADERLRAIGEEARKPLLRAAASEEAELRFRARAILAALDRQADQRWLGPAWTVTIPEADYSLEEIRALVQKQIPCPLTIPGDLSFARLNIGAKKQGVLEFMDRIAAAQGNLAVPRERTSDALQLVRGKPWKGAVSYSGPFRISLERITLETWEHTDITRSAAWLLLDVSWQPNVHPLAGRYLRTPFSPQFFDVELTDANGAPILGIGPEQKASFWLNFDREFPGGWRGRVRIPDPPASVRRLSAIRGKVRLLFPEKLEILEFKNPLQEGVQEMKSGSVSVRLSDCRKTEDGVTARFTFRAPRMTPASLKRHEDFTLIPNVAESEAKVVDAGGQTTPFTFMLGDQPQWDRNFEIRSYSGYFPTEALPEKITIPVVGKAVDVEIPFEFKNVDFP